jgi:hypothetical protein
MYCSKKFEEREREREREKSLLHFLGQLHVMRGTKNLQYRLYTKKKTNQKTKKKCILSRP